MKSSFIYRTAFVTGILILPFGQLVTAEETASDEEAAKKTLSSEKNSGKQAEKLTDITVQATRVDKSLYEIPASVGFVDKDDIQFGRQQLGLDESLNKIPGLWMPNRYNFNQDLSISIRGFGKRSTFGIRGVKIFVDGIPNTLPDGQGGIDSIDIGSTDRIEVIRGPSSSLYGASAGGVINLYTEDGPAVPFVEGRALSGSYNFSQFQLKTGGQKDALNYLFNLTRLNLDGYRDHSKIERTMLNSKLNYEIDNTSDLTFTLNILDKPIADDPGGLTEAQVKADREAAQFNNSTARFDAGESVEQQQFGFLYRKSVGDKHEIIARNYYQFRNFDAKLPVGPLIGVSGGLIELDRFFLGGGLQDTYTDSFFGHRNRLTVGFDVDSQMDERKNFENLLGAMGALTLDQDEDVFSWGVYLQNEFSLTDNLELTFGVRYDEVEFEFTDYFLADADQSGSAEFSEWSPQVGLLWKFHEAINVFGNVSTAFETPSTREFASPVGPGGFNTSLDAQTSTNYEIGIKGFLPGRTSYELSVFRIDTTDELLPAGENAGGSVFFTNTGETRRYGVEAGLVFRPLAGLDITLNYTYSDFEFTKLVVPGFGSFDGDKIPGIPEQTAYAEIAYFAPSGFYGALDFQYVDKVYTNNAFIRNSGALVTQGAAADDYTLLNFRAGYTTNIGDTEFTPFFAINNITNQEYIGNVRVNEGNIRFFEPAPELNVFAGISLTFR